jgi:hypothetical protein
MRERKYINKFSNPIMQYDEYFIRIKIWFKNVSSEVFTVDSLFG